jgi:3-methyladenine DNA glycosylase AlkD
MSKIAKPTTNGFSNRFFMPQPETDELIDRLLKLIDLRKNGETVDQQKQLGISYRLSYGVALAHIKEIARGIAPDNELAKRLWYRQVRESMILATLLAEPSTLRPNELIDWCSLIDNPELAEQMAINLLGKMQNILLVVPMLITDGNPNQKATAFFALGWALRNQLIAPSDIIPFEILMLPDDKTTSSVEKRSIAHLIKQMARHSSEGKKQAEAWLDQARQKQLPLWDRTLDDVQTELNWINEQ